MEGSAITVKIGAETDGIQQGLKNIQNSLKNLEGTTKNSAAEFGASFTKIAGAVAVGQAAFEGFKAAASFGLSAVTDSIGALVGSFGSAIDAAAEMETLETAFIPLLGSADAAQSRIAELAKFAAETPFEMPEIAKASKTLETLTRGALSTAEGLRLVGDVASATNTPFEEISTTIGRLYDGLQSGRPVGEVMQRLQELGAVSGDTRAEIEALSASGKNTEAWLVAEDALSRFSGSMKLQSSTWAGLLSTFSDNVTQALAKFGEPILDNLKPYLSASIKLVEMLAEKSADFGKEFSEQFIASSSAAKAFQTAIEAINIGETSKGFDLFWQTTKLQVQETGNSIINIFSATFATVSDIISQIFRADGPALLTITSAFDAVAGKLKASIAGGLVDTIRSLGPAFSNIADGLEQSAAAGATQAELALQRIPVAAGLAAEDIGTVLGGSVDLFKKNLGEANTQFFDTSAAAQQVADIEAEIAAKVAETNAARGETTAQLDAEKNRRQEIRDAAQAAAEEERANSLALVELETALNTAKAAGNEELVTALEQEKTRLENQQEIAKLTEEYQKTLGVNADEAARLATNFVNAKDAASGVSVNSSSIKSAKQEAQEAAKAAESFASWLGFIKDSEAPKGIRALAGDSKAAKEEIAAFGDYIGVDLKNKDFPDIARKLGIYDVSKSGKEQIASILEYVEGQRKNLLVQPIDEAGANASLAKIQTRLKETLTGQKTDVTLDASTSIATIKSQIGNLKGEVDLALSSSQGTAHLSTISGLMGDLKGLMTTLTNKLPSPVLT